MGRELELIKCEDVVAIDGRGIGILQECAKVIACHCWQCLVKSSWAKKGTVNGIFGFGGVRLR